MIVDLGAEARVSLLALMAASLEAGDRAHATPHGDSRTESASAYVRRAGELLAAADASEAERQLDERERGSF